ncbi:MAG TPA: hypothetical protein VE128_00930 [Candidatus Angelobacter sp.]|nr:hypothetical protein [Candidatus Angelobacter sp.]
MLMLLLGYIGGINAYTMPDDEYSLWLMKGLHSPISFQEFMIVPVSAWKFFINYLTYLSISVGDEGGFSLILL